MVSNRLRAHTITTILGLLGLAATIPMPSIAQILPADRATDWNPGIPGGIPVRTTVCANINAATYGNGTQNARAAIQAAIDACPTGQVVQLSAGRFQISGDPLFLYKGITLRGAGPQLTELRQTSFNQALLVVGRRWEGPNNATNLTANAVKGNRSVTVASTAGLSVGDIVHIDMLAEDPYAYWGTIHDGPGGGSRRWFARQDRPLQQRMEIAAISGNTVTFNTPFHFTFKTAYSAQLAYFTADLPKYIGVEDLKLYGGQGGDGGGNLYMENTAYSWAQNIESTATIGGSGRLSGCFRCVIRDSYFHDSPDNNPGGAGYGIDIRSGTADSLIENNISVRFNKTLLMRSSGGGNVVGYNYFDDGYGEGYKNCAEVGLNASHYATAHMELFEGNQAWNIIAETYWGNSTLITFLRNHVTTKRTDTAKLGLVDSACRRGVEVYARNLYYSFIGNVLGYEGMTPAPGYSSFEYEDVYPFGDGGKVPMWRLGSSSESTPQFDGKVDQQVVTTTLREGNYDFVTRTVKWDGPVQAIPNSLYLKSKPSFFGDCPWPWVDPQGDKKTHVLPARARFEAKPDACRASTRPLPPTDFEVS